MFNYSIIVFYKYLLILAQNNKYGIITTHGGTYMYYITEEDLYQRNFALSEMISDYKKKQSDYKAKKNRQSYFDMLNIRRELTMFLRKIVVDSEHNLDTENQSLLSLFQSLMSITTLISDEECLINFAKSNLQTEIREDRILMNAEYLKENLDKLDNDLDKLLELTKNISEIKQRSK